MTYYWLSYKYLDTIWNICTIIHPFKYIQDKPEFELINWKIITAEDFNLFEELNDKKTIKK